jgi:hypothetical protein
LKSNLNKTKILVFKNGGKLKKGEQWTVNDQIIEVADEINYLGVTFENSGRWKRQKFKTVAKGNRTLLAIDRCLARTADMTMKLVENVYEVLSESRTGSR